MLRQMDPFRAPCGADSLRPLLDGLCKLGFAVPPLFGPQGNVAGGVPLEVPVSELLDQEARGSGIDAIRSLLRDGTPVMLSLPDPATGGAASGALMRFGEWLLRELESSRDAGRHVGIGIQAGQLPAFRAVAERLRGPRYVLFGSSHAMHRRDLQSAMEETWSVLWRDRMRPAALKPAYACSVKTGCPLLADEAATSVLPVHGIRVPAGSAWLPLCLSLPDFAHASGEIAWERLSRTISRGLSLAEQIMDRLHWPHPGQRADAGMNRRLAVSCTGLGDLVVRRGLEPADLDTLRWLTDIVVRVRNMLWQASGQLARRKGFIPALRACEPSQRWDDGAHREHWRQRWHAALEKSAVRHRNLFVLSPYAVLPSTGNVSSAYTDLLPVIAFADAWSFAEAPPFRDFDIDEFRTFHSRARAVIGASRTGSLVAAGV